MGTGKSSVGRRLAQRLHMDFYDVDEEIAAVTGLDLMTLYWKCGKIRFQSEENLILCKLLRKEYSVIATGGTLEPYEERLMAMRDSGVLVCLKAETEIIKKRVVQKRNRPLLRLKPGSDRFEQLYKWQRSWEANADLVVDTTEKNFDEILQMICAVWECEMRGIL